jgi:hypothetical protein
MDHVSLRIIEDLLTHKRKRSWSALARDIADANQATGLQVDRRTLARLCGKNSEKVKLSISQLLALNEYLRQRSPGRGLDQKPLFVRQEDIVDSVSESDALTIFVAAKYSETDETETVSRWDLRAVTDFTSGKLAGKTLKIQDVLLHGTETGVAKDEKWVELLKREEAKVAKITIGSPLANPATEYALAAMVGRKPYEHSSPDDGHPLPFYFLFLDRECPSTFFLRPRDRAQLKSLLGEREARKLSTMKSDQRAIVLLDELLVSEPKRLGRSYGILVAQRQAPKGDVMMSVCGTYGQTTLGVSRVTASNKIRTTLPPFDEKLERQPILVAAVEAFTVPRQRSVLRQSPPTQENRRLEGYKAAGEARLLHFANGKWA